MDTGAERTLLSRRVFNSMTRPPSLRKSDINLESVTGNQVKIDGSIDLEFVVGGLRLHNVFYVVPNLGRNAILGRDFLRHFNCRIYYDLDKLLDQPRLVITTLICKMNKQRIQKFRRFYVKCNLGRQAKYFWGNTFSLRVYCILSLSQT